jgi:hypothetical protein
VARHYAWAIKRQRTPKSATPLKTPNLHPLQPAIRQKSCFGTAWSAALRPLALGLWNAFFGTRLLVVVLLLEEEGSESLAKGLAVR